MTRIEPTFEVVPEPEDELAEPRAVETVAEAEGLLLYLMDVMDALLDLVERETQLVRAGRHDTATRLQQAKTDLARHYMAAIAGVRASQAFLRRAVPDALAALHRRHDMFRALLQINLTVLAIAQAVTEGSDARADEQRPDGAAAERASTARRRLPMARGWPGLRPPSRAQHAILDMAPLSSLRDRRAVAN